MLPTKGYAAQSATSPLAPYTFERRDPGPQDVAISIEFCGICHSDIHQAKDEWSNSLYPMVPGHEIVGRVTAVGADVSRFKAGDLVGVGVLVDSCRECSACLANMEQCCLKTAVQTYNSRDYDGNPTFGGYSDKIVVDQHYVLSISSKLDLAAVAPLLCAGITTYSPLRHWKVGPNSKVGIVGLGGLGHMGLKFAHAFGAHVVQFTTSESKIADAKRLGADEVVITKDPAQMKKHLGSFDFILDSISAEHDLNAYLNMLTLDGTLCLVGAPERALPVEAFSVIVNRRSLAGSSVGGILETQQMLDFCAEKNIVSDIELTTVNQLAEAYDRVLTSDVKYRFVIDMKSLN